MNRRQDAAPPAPRRHREKRQRTRDFDWWDERERAETVQCPPRPKGCRAPIGQTCRDPHSGLELTNQTAHMARVQLSEQAEPTAGATAPTHDMEDA